MARALRQARGERCLSLGIGHSYTGDDRRTIAQAYEAATLTGLPLVACPEVYYHASSRRPLADVLTCTPLSVQFTNP